MTSSPFTEEGVEAEIEEDLELSGRFPTLVLLDLGAPWTAPPPRDMGVVGKLPPLM